MKLFQGKVAIITGSSRGIGLAIAKRLAMEGAKVMLTGRDEAMLSKHVVDMNKSEKLADYVALDLSKPDSPGQLVERTLQRFGKIDIVVNNAGVTKRGDFLTLTESDWADGFALKFYGAVRLSRAAWPYLKQARGSIVMIAGVGGRTPGPHFTIGGSVNAAMLSLTKALSDLGIQDGVQVNAINPGFIRTDRFNLRLKTFAETHQLTLKEAEQEMIKEAGVAKVGEPDDVAALVAFLVSDAGRLLQGSCIDADLGQTKTI